MEFGECWQAALVREFKEELGVDVQVIAGPHVMENIYLHEGEAGHEIVFIGEVMFPAEAFAGQDSITFLEDSGVACTARWYDVAKLDLAGGPALYPAGLKERLLNTGAQSAPAAPVFNAPDQPLSAESTSSSIFFASPNSIRLLSL